MHGSRQAKIISIRLAKLRAAYSLHDFWPPNVGPDRCHELIGDRKGQLSVDLDYPYRLIFVPNHEPIPRRSDGGLDWKQVTSVMIIGIEDTHE